MFLVRGFEVLIMRTKKKETKKGPITLLFIVVRPNSQTPNSRSSGFTASKQTGCWSLSASQSDYEIENNSHKAAASVTKK